MATKRSKRMKTVRAWAGVVDGRCGSDTTPDTYGWASRPDVFLTRGDARKRYEEVRRVEIREVPRGR